MPEIKRKRRESLKKIKTLPMRFSKNINIAKDLVIKYGITEGCYGCNFALGEITYAKGHNDAGRQRFMELSETPGYEDLKIRFNKSIEKATRKWLETKGNQEEEEPSGKRTNMQDERSRSKQMPAQSSGSGITEEERNKAREEANGQTGTERTSWKVSPTERNETDEPEAKRARGDR